MRSQQEAAEEAAWFIHRGTSRCRRARRHARWCGGVTE